MRVNANQLEGTLKKGLAPLYLVAGDEPLLVQEACDLIRKQALEAGFTDRKVFHAEGQFDWQTVAEETQALSLFATRQRIEIHLPNGKIGKGAAVVEQFLAAPPEDVILILISPRLDSGELRKKWLKKVQSDAVQVQIWPVDHHQFPKWLMERAQRQGLQLTEGALERLTERLEGNLLAASQELDRLKLLVPEATVDESHVESSVLDSARFSSFEFVAETLLGRVSHAQRMLSRLQQEGFNSLAVLALLTKDLKRVQQLQAAQKRGQDTASFFRDARIRQRDQQKALAAAANRLPPQHINHLFQLCAEADQAAKGFLPDTPWERLRELVVAAGSNRYRPLSMR
ncbi:DNA polymerase III subunit delta [Marinobacteraceae bacterium S3BR75-40.1]